MSLTEPTKEELNGVMMGSSYSMTSALSSMGVIPDLDAADAVCNIFYLAIHRAVHTTLRALEGDETVLDDWASDMGYGRKPKKPKEPKIRRKPGEETVDASKTSWTVRQYGSAHKNMRALSVERGDGFLTFTIRSTRSDKSKTEVDMQLSTQQFAELCEW